MTGGASGGEGTGGHAGSALDRARVWVHSAERIVALTGAGISTDSGIPDYRGPQGVWTKDPEAEKTARLSYYLEDPEIRRRSWRNRLSSPAWQAQPNPGHLALVDLERRGKLLALITQNVDGLHLVAGSSPERVIEIHGTMRYAVCWSCGDRRPMEEVLVRVRAGEEDPACRQPAAGGGECGGIIKSDTISFGQSLVAEDMARAERAAQSCDLLLAVGSSLGVYPAAGVVPVAARAGAKVVIVNAEPTAMDRLADVVIRGSISEVLPVLVAPAG